MIDFYIKEALDDHNISFLLQRSLDLEEDDIFICSNEYLENCIISKSYACLCVKSIFNGDVSILLELHRVKFNVDIFLRKLQCFCKDKEITCYVPSNDFDNYYVITPNRKIFEVMIDQDRTEDKELYFTA